MMPLTLQSVKSESCDIKMEERYKSFLKKCDGNTFFSRVNLTIYDVGGHMTCTRQSR